MANQLEALERVEVVSREALRAWLRVNYASADSHWLVTYKKAAGDNYLSYNEIVEELLCFGWVDSLPRALDQQRTMVLISPRKPGSNWSKDNRERIARLEALDRMHPAGQKCVALAKQDGSWDRLKQTETGQAPADLQRELEAAGAVEQWNGFSLSVRRRSLELLLAAKRPQTRANRIAKIVKASAAGVDPTLWKPKSR